MCIRDSNRTRVKVVKNKCAPPFRQAEFDIMYGAGISREGSVIDLGSDLDIVKKSGAWYTYEGEQLWQGRDNAKRFLTENPEVMMEITDRVWREAMPDTEESVEAVKEEAELVDEFTETDDLPIELEE